MGFYYRGMESPEYWRQRAIDRDKAARKSEDQVIREINDLYSQTFREVKMELDTWFNTYARDNNMTLAEARRKLTPMEMRTYKTHMERMKKIYNASHSPFVKAEIDKLGARAYVTRQMALIDSIDKILIETSHNVQLKMEDHLIGMYQREYKNTLEELRIKGTVIPEKAIREIIDYPYAGNMFSNRIWNNKATLINYIEKDLAKGLIKGSSIQRMSKDLMNRCDVLYHQAARLVRTETNYVMNQGHLNGYKDAGIKEYKFLAFIDHRTSPQCKGLDGQVIDANDATVGANLPPLHPNCRSTIIPIVTRDYLNSTKEETPGSTEGELIFKNSKEAAKYLQNNYGFEKVSFGSKTSTDMAISLVNSSKKVYDKYPELKGFVRKFETGSMNKTYAHFRYGYNKDGNVLSLKTSSTLMDTIEKAKEHYNKDLKRAFHPKGTTYEDVIVHEFGHVIDAYLTAKKLGISEINHNKITKEEMVKLFYEYDSKAVSTSIIDQAFKNLDIIEMKDKSEAIRSLSRYSLESRRETFAEAFADYMANGENAHPISKEIFKIVNKEMKK